MVEYTLKAQKHKRWELENLFDKDNPEVRVSGKVYDDDEILGLVEAAVHFNITEGHIVAEFEAEFANFVDAKYARMVNSGSSANLLALSALMSEELGDSRLKPGSEVIAVACAFPTTVNPIIQLGLIPVFVDVDAQGRVDISALDDAVMIAHPLGNPFDTKRILSIVSKYDDWIWLVEDCCDSLGSTLYGDHVGKYADLATYSFYPAHHITTGEGGMVTTNNPKLDHLVRSYRDWGRSCYCAPGQDNACGKRFEQQHGDLPHGYDHKYTYDHIGYNLKSTDLQAAIGLAQMKKLSQFIIDRKRNWGSLRKRLEQFGEYLLMPEQHEGADASWFGFLVCLNPYGFIERSEVIRFLNKNGIHTRMLFGGNLLKQPAYKDVLCKIVGGLDNTDYLTEHAFWIGVFPGLTDEHLDYVEQKFVEFFKSKGLA